MIDLEGLRSEFPYETAPTRVGGAGGVDVFPALSMQWEGNGGVRQLLRRLLSL